MDGLRPAPRGLPLRAWLLLTAAAVGLLAWQTGTWTGVVGLLSGTLPLEAGAPGYLRGMLGRGLRTWGLVSGALVFGASAALAITCAGTRTGRVGLKMLSWLGRLLAGVPVMLWALLAMVLLIQRWQVPVETLFPYQPPAERDSTALSLGRQLWALLLPITVLAVPATGVFLAVLAQRAGDLPRQAEVQPLRARGIPHGLMLHRHLLPHLVLHLARQARSCLPLLLAFCIPVEEALGVHGLGQSLARALGDLSVPGVLPVSLYLFAWMLLPWLLVLAWLERQSAVSAIEQGFPTGAPRNLLSAAAGVLLMGALMVAPPRLAAFSEARLAWPHELWFALQAVAAACAIVLLSLPVWQVWDRLRPAWHLGLVPAVASEGLMFLVLLVTSPLWMGLAFPPGVVGGLLALAGIAILRQDARELSHRPMMEAAQMLGGTSSGILRRHYLRFLLPSLGRWALRMMAVVLMLMALVHYQVPAGPEAPASWGGQMRLASGGIFDDARPVAAPAVLLALWCLAFFLLSRVFRSDLPARQLPAAYRHDP